MHAQLLSIIDRKLEDAMIKFAQLPIQSEEFNCTLYDQLHLHTRKLVETYISLERAIKLMFHEYVGCYKRQILIKHSLNQEADGNNELISPSIQKIIDDKIQPYLKNTSTINQIIPIHERYTETLETIQITGISLIERRSSTAISLLHKLGIPLNQIEFSLYHTNYLNRLLKAYIGNENLNIRDMIFQSGKTYKQFQKDSKSYFGTTFYSFFLKIKMFNVLDDIMFTDSSLKEIAFNNNFSHYSNMHRAFKAVRFPISSVPRFSKEIRG